MSLLKDKYTPKTLDDAYFHKEEFNMLKTMSKDDSIPNIIIYGSEGTGKTTCVRLLLEMIYDKEVHNINNATYTVVGSGNNSTPVDIKQSNYHIVIEPGGNNFDRYLIQDVVKEYAKRIPFNVYTTNKIFKTVLINNIDNLSYYAQTSLRRTMEKYSGTCRFIMKCTSLSKVIEPLCSRCLCFRLEAPTDGELFERVYEISKQENINLSLKNYTDITTIANGNIKTAMWLLDLSKYGLDYTISYNDALKDIIMLMKQCITAKIDDVVDKLTFMPQASTTKSVTPKKTSVRDILYNIMITNISGTQIIRDLMLLLCDDVNIPDKCKYQIIEIASKFEHKLIRGRREIAHLEAYIIKVIKTLIRHNIAHTNFGNKHRFS